MQQLGGHHVVWVRVLLLIATTTFILVVGSGAAYAQIAVNTDDLGNEVATTVENAGDTVATTVENAGDTVAPTAAGGAVENVTNGAGGVVKNVTNGAGDAVNDVTNGAGGAVENVTNGAGDAVENVTNGAGGAVNDVTNGAGDAVKDVTNGAGGAVNDVTNGADGAVESVTNGAGDAVKDVTGGAGPALKGVTGSAGGAGDDASALPDQLVASVTPRPQNPPLPTLDRSGADGNSISLSQRSSEDPTFIERGADNDLPAVVQAPGSTLGDSLVSPDDASAGAVDFELPFGLGTLPLTGIELALIMLLGLGTAFVGWAMVRSPGIIEARKGAPQAQTVTSVGWF